jgi:hypothetical protein
LPRELRDLIIKYSFEPRALFYHGLDDRVKPGFCLPDLGPRDKPELQGDELIGGDELYNGDNRFGLHWRSHMVEARQDVLTYKLSTFMPLLLVNKQVSAEVQVRERGILKNWSLLDCEDSIVE